MSAKVLKITKTRVYKKLFKSSGRLVRRNYILLYITRKNINSSMASINFGITTSKKIGNAVTRNRCKRVIRILIKRVRPIDLENHLYINIIARKFLVNKKTHAIQNSFNIDIKKVASYEKSHN